MSSKAAVLSGATLNRFMAMNMGRLSCEVPVYMGRTGTKRIGVEEVSGRGGLGPKKSLEDDDARVLGLGVRLHMDRNERILDLGPQRPLKAITDVVGLRHAHVARNHEMKI